MKAEISIEYCPKCHWLLRAAYMAQEILSTFTDDIKRVSLIPSNEAGHFSIRANEQLIFDRKTYGGFPEIKELKQKIRDCIHPGMNLGHSDNIKPTV